MCWFSFSLHTHHEMPLNPTNWSFKCDYWVWSYYLGPNAFHLTRLTKVKDGGEGMGFSMNAFTCYPYGCLDICPGRFPSFEWPKTGKASPHDGWIIDRLPVCHSDEPCRVPVSVKHHLITGCVFIIIIVVIIIIIISLHPSLKAETMGSLKRLLLNWSSVAFAASVGPTVVLLSSLQCG